MPSVGECMSRDLVAVEQGATLRAAAERMTGRRVGSVLVLEDERLLGILTERDVLRAFARGTAEHDLVSGCMTANPETIDPSEPVERAAVLMLHGGFRHLPVVDGQRVVGVLSIRDLVGATLADQAPRGV